MTSLVGKEVVRIFRALTRWLANTGCLGLPLVGLGLLIGSAQLGTAAEGEALPTFESRQDHIDFHRSRGAVLLKQGRYNQALKEFDEALALGPELVDTYKLRATAFFAKGDYASAVADCDTVLRLRPNDPEGLANRANALSGLGRLEEATKSFDKADKLQPNNVYVLLNRGYVYGKRGMFDNAIADFSRVLEIQPDNAKALRLRAKAYASSGDRAKAEADMARADRLTAQGPGRWSLHYCDPSRSRDLLRKIRNVVTFRQRRRTATIGFELTKQLGAYLVIVSDPLSALRSV